MSISMIRNITLKYNMLKFQVSVVQPVMDEDKEKYILSLHQKYCALVKMIDLFFSVQKPTLNVLKK